MTTKVGNGLDLQGQRIQNIGDPSSPGDATSKQYVDAALRNLSWKEEVVAAATGNVNLASPGASFDGVTLTAGDRVLLMNQTAQAENGAYVWQGATSALTRALDSTTGAQLSGSAYTIQRGTVYADRMYRVLTDDAITVGTTAITFGQVGGASQMKTAGAGLTETGSTYDVGQGTGILVGADTVSIDPSVVARRFSTSVGGATSVNVDHNLGTLDVEVQTFDNADGSSRIDDVLRVSVNRITINFAVAPAASAVRVVVVG